MEAKGFAFPPPLPPQFGKYNVLGHLATGGMAEVYVARATGIGGFEKIVVIKRIRPDLFGDREMTEAFLHEAKLAATLEHPNIAQVHEIGIVSDSYFFAMEYVHGADLREVMETAVQRDRPVPLADATQIIIGVCAALHYAHEKRDLHGAPLGIIHRDASPSNVLVSDDGAVKVCDFGIAKAATRTRETVRGVVKGKFSYMSPEQCRAAQLDRRSDIFTIGILLYELSTLTQLFDGASDFEVMRKILEEPIVPPSVVCPGYPAELERIVHKALSRDPRDRYPTAQAMQLDLEAFAREQKLALSAVRVAALMRELFADRTDPWSRITPGSSPGRASLGPLGPPGPHDESLDPDVRLELATGSGPAVAADTTAGAAADTTAGAAAATVPGSRRQALPEPQPARRPTRAFAIAAVLALLAGGGAFGAEQVLAASHRRTAEQALDEDARQLAAALDAQVNSAHLRCDAMAGTPMMRAAVGTDAATAEDMARDGILAVPGHGEVIELFQHRDDGAAARSLLRLPAGAAPLPPMAGREARLAGEHGEIHVHVSAPIPHYRAGDPGGALELVVPADLALVRARLAEHAVRATLEGLREPILLAGAAPVAQATGAAEAGAVMRVPLPPLASRADLALAIIAAPFPQPMDWGWLRLASYGMGALAGVLLAAHVALRLLARRRYRFRGAMPADARISAGS